MILRALGGLELEGSTFSRPKPLLLLSYLSLEGPQPRRDLAELFWLDAANPLASLSMALSQLREAAPGLIESGDQHVATRIDSDARQLLDRLDSGERMDALGIYRGRFLAGVRPGTRNAELEEWVLLTREYLAGRVRRVWLQLAEESAGIAAWSQAASHAERAWTLPGAAPADDEELRRIHAVLHAADMPLAQAVVQEAEELGVDLKPRKGPGPARDFGHRPGSLPGVHGPLVGREQELDEIKELFSRQDVRLVTLLGPGGIGKTRLAIGAAARIQPQDFPAGAWFVPLATVPARGSVPEAILDGLHERVAPGEDPVTYLCSHIGSQELMLLLDNFEHLEGAAPLLVELLERCAGLRIIVTSRVRLGIEAEHSFPVPGLAFPQSGELSVSEAQDFAAVEMFVRRTRRVNPGFELDGSNLDAVIGICRFLEGLPLGLELAASWSHILPPDEIALELAENSDLPGQLLNEVPVRHESLHNAFSYSWRLLAESERDVLLQLAVFRGGFRRDAARAVAGATTPVLAALVDKSMLRVDRTGRFSHHPMILQYTSELLQENPILAAETMVRHQEWFEGFLKRWHSVATTGELNRALTAIDIERSNVRAAWNHMIGTGDATALQAVLGALSYYFDRRKRYAEGREFMDLALDAFQGSGALVSAEGSLLTEKAWFLYQAGEYEEADRLASQALRALSDGGAVSRKCRCLNVLASTAFARGDFELARRSLLEASGLARGLGSSSELGTYVSNLGIAEHALGELDSARDRFEAGIAIAREEQDHYHIITRLNMLGVLDIDRRDFVRAIHSLDEGLELARSHGLADEVPRILVNQGIVAEETGHPDRASSLLLDAEKLLAGGEDAHLLAFINARLGKLAVKLKQTDSARRHFMQALDAEQGWTDIQLEVASGLAELHHHEERPAEAAGLYELLLCHPSVEELDRKRYVDRLAQLREGLPAEMESAGPGALQDVLAGFRRESAGLR